MKIIKRLAQGVGTLVVFFAVICIVVLSQININQYKDDINSELTNIIGHETQINGELKWKWWPYFGFFANDIIVKDKGKIIANLAHMDARINYTPLMQGQLVVKRLDAKNINIQIPWPRRSIENQSSEPVLHKLHSHKTKINAINLQNINLFHQGYMVSIDKLQAIDMHTGSPFPFFAGVHLKDRPTYMRPIETPIHFYDGKIKGTVTFPKNFLALSKLERVDAFLLDSEIRAKRIRFFYSYGKRLTSKVLLKNGVLGLSDFQFDAAGGLVKGNLTANLIKRDVKFDISAEDIDISNLKTRFPLLNKGEANVHATINAKTDGRNIVIPSLDGKIHFNITNGTLLSSDSKIIINSASKLIESYETSNKTLLADEAAAVASRNLLDIHGKVGTDFQLWKGNIHFEAKLMKLENIIMYAGPYRIELTGAIDMHRQTIDGDVMLHFAEQSKDKLPSNLQRLKGYIPLKIKGNTSNLQLTLDVEKIMNDLASNETTVNAVNHSANPKPKH